MSHEKQGPHHCRVVIIHLHPLWPWGWGGGGSGIWVSVAWGLVVLVVGVVSVVASASVLGRPTDCSRGRLLAPAGAGAVLLPNLCAGYEACGDHIGSSVAHPAASGSSAGTAAVRAPGRPWTAVCGQHTLVHGGLWHSTRLPTAQPFTRNAVLKAALCRCMYEQSCLPCTWQCNLR